MTRLDPLDRRAMVGDDFVAAVAGDLPRLRRLARLLVGDDADDLVAEIWNAVIDQLGSTPARPHRRRDRHAARLFNVR